jgi:ABC-type nitrate/sulfonate/bicarbonate transport system permease component
MQVLIGFGVGSAINTVLGFVLNRQPHTDGVRHHFFFMPMQWPALAITVVCTLIALLK